MLLIQPWPIIACEGKLKAFPKELSRWEIHMAEGAEGLTLNVMTRKV